MFKGKKVVCIIPARLASVRFPKKILTLLRGKPLLQRVWEAVQKISFFDEIVFAVDAKETANLVKNFGGKFIMTSINCKSGTDRLVDIMHSGKIESDVWVCWQADEPFVKQKMIEQLLFSCDKDNAQIWTLRKRIKNKSDVINSNVVKVVCDNNGFALYFSRSEIPFYRDESLFKNRIYYKHIGLYAYTTNALRQISYLNCSYLEEAESLEQLRFLHYGLSICVHETDSEIFGINTAEDLEKAERFYKE